MSNLWSNISSPRQLVIFESAARLGSFSRAAEELKMQQPSVSAAIKQVESDLGITLFYRSHRKVTLTSAGERLYAGVAAGLADIETAINAVREMTRPEHVTLSTSSAFSYYWMMPRMTRFREHLPDVDLRMQNSDREPDLDIENISLAIRLGDGHWSGYDSAKLADEILYPVASPIVMATANTLRSIPNLLHQRLIHLEEPIRERPTWADWFAHHKINHEELKRHRLDAGLRLNDYALVLQAAVSGEGFATGWDHIVSNMIERNVLAARKEWSWHTGRGVYLVWSTNKPLSNSAMRVRDWIIKDAAVAG